MFLRRQRKAAGELKRVGADLSDKQAQDSAALQLANEQCQANQEKVRYKGSLVIAMSSHRFKPFRRLLNCSGPKARFLLP